MEELENETENETGNFQQETIKGLVYLYYKNFTIPSTIRVQNAWGLCYAIARRFNSEDDIKRLNKMFNSAPKSELPLGLVETIVTRDLNMGKSINTTYNYGYGRKPVNLSTLIISLTLTFVDITDIFTDICVRNEIDTNLIDPYMFLQQEQKAGL